MKNCTTNNDYQKWKETKIENIKNNPEEHKHTYDDLITCCRAPDGSLDLSIIDIHSKYVDLGTNGGIKCDTIEGPCACGAWH